MIEFFERRFSAELGSCKSNMARLVLMQHFGLPTRALDIAENPLASLYFACSPMKKFGKDRKAEMSAWGEVAIFKDSEGPGEDEEDENPEGMKAVGSSTTSVLASTAFMNNVFSLWHLGTEWKRDNNYARDETRVPLREIVRRSVIVRVPQDNPRIRNQQGAFILVNASEVYEINEDKSHAKELTDFILNAEYEVRFSELMENPRWSRLFSPERNPWELVFKKVKPYSCENSNKIFDTDPFDLHRLFYKKGGVQQVVLIPPKFKEGIIKELEKFNITEDFVYPDMDTVSNEINGRINISK